ncbi:hypothetical protein evm_014714 [Chilo suppressalis]|nr:hypothetical protein evm_014714 [Chilo suppressalis]
MNTKPDSEWRRLVRTFPQKFHNIVDQASKPQGAQNFDETTKKTVSMQQFLRLNMRGKIILGAILPPQNNDYKCVTYKIMPKAQNAHAIVNAGFLFKYNTKDNVVRSARIVYGGLSPYFIRSNSAEKFLMGKILFQNQTLQSVIGILDKELIVTEDLPQPPSSYRKQLAISLFYKSLLSLCPTSYINPRFRSAAIRLNEMRSLSTGHQEYTTFPSLYPLNQPLPKIEALAQCAGEAMYTDDGPELANEVHAAFVLSTIAKGKINSIDSSKALSQPGVIAFYTAKDIPGLNSFIVKEDSTNSANEEVLCSGNVNYYNQPIGIIVAETQKNANKAAKMVCVEYVNVCQPITDVTKAKTDKNRLHIYKSISAQSTGTDITKIIRGSSTIRGQYHFIMETFVCVTRPSEDGFEVYTTSQWIDSVQMMISRALNIEENREFPIFRHCCKRHDHGVTAALATVPKYRKLAKNKEIDFQPPEQAGFERALVTMDTIHTLRQIIQKTEEYNRPLCLAYVDYEKAFDSVETWAVLQSLQPVPN